MKHTSGDAAPLGSDATSDAPKEPVLTQRHKFRDAAARGACVVKRAQEEIGGFPAAVFCVLFFAAIPGGIMAAVPEENPLSCRVVFSSVLCIAHFRRRRNNAGRCSRCASREERLQIASSPHKSIPT